MDFLSIEGRFVQGDPFEPQTKDQQGNPLTIKTGPNAGQPTQQFFMAVAFPKSDPRTPGMLAGLKNAMAAEWPRLFTAPTDVPPLFGCQLPRFSSKIVDGDGLDDNGRSNAEKPGFAGNWVLRLASQFPPRVYEAGKYDELQRVDMDRAKHGLLQRGFYVRVAGSYQSNKNDQRPGMYLNLNMVEIVRPGEVIVTGPSAAAVFGGAAPAPAPAAPVPAPVAPVPAPAPVAPAPYAGYMDPSGAPQGFKLTEKAQGATYQQLLAAGWTDPVLKANGLMVSVDDRIPF